MTLARRVTTTLNVPTHIPHDRHTFVRLCRKNIKDSFGTRFALVRFLAHHGDFIFTGEKCALSDTGCKHTHTACGK